MDETRELLSRHVAIATFSGTEEGRESMLRIYPPQPPKQWATFAIEEYEEYDKTGKYGDEQQTRFAFVAAEEADAGVVATLGTLTAGDRVRIAWRHEYVTRKEEGGSSSSFPERPVSRLEKL